MTQEDGTWVTAAGYRRRRSIEGLLAIIVAIPFFWTFYHREFRNSRFQWALLVWLVGTLLVRAWSASGIRCRRCGIPIYLYWSLGFPIGRGKGRFGSLTHCPYCGDDGSGETGDPSRVEATKEARRVIRNVIFSFLVVFAGVCALVLAMAFGYIPS